MTDKGLSFLGPSGQPPTFQINPDNAAQFRWRLPNGTFTDWQSAPAGAPGVPADLYPTVAAAAASNLTAVTAVYVSGYAAAGIGGGRWRKVGSMPGHTARFQDTAGNWFEPDAADTLDLLQVGGSDDGTTFNDAAWARALSFLAGGYRNLRLPKRGAGIYQLQNQRSVGGVTLVAEPGVILRGPYEFSVDVRVANSLELHQTLSGTYTFVFGREFQRPFGEREIWLSEGDLDRSSVADIDCTTLTHRSAPQGSDTWSTVSPVAVDAVKVTWDITADSVWRASFKPLRGGDELTCVFKDASYMRAAIVRTSGGVYFFRAPKDDFASLDAKLTGVAVSTIYPIGWLGFGSHDSWNPNYAEWTIRVLAHDRFAILMNGTQIYSTTVAGEIIDAGFGVFGSLALSGITISWWARAKKSEARGQRPIQLLPIGDSLTDTGVHGAWPWWAREALDGAFGIRVHRMDGYAVSGNTSADQLAHLTALGLPANDSTLNIYPVIMVGTNDVQVPLTVTQTQTNVGGIVDYLVAHGVPAANILLMTFPLWYPQGLAGGAGVPTYSYAAGAPYRAMLRKLSVAKGVAFFDVNQVTGQVISDWLGLTSEMDATLRDNLHGTAWLNKILGFNIARKLAAMIVPRMSPVIAEKALPLATFAGSLLGTGWAATTDAPTYRVAGGEQLAAIATVRGTFDKSAGSIADDTVIYTFPENLRPKSAIHAPAKGSTGDTGMLSINTAGQLSVKGFSGSDTWVALPPLSFEVA